MHLKSIIKQWPFILPANMNDSRLNLKFTEIYGVSIFYGISLVYVWYMCGICVVYVWYMCGITTCVVYVWYMFGLWYLRLARQSWLIWLWPHSMTCIDNLLALLNSCDWTLRTF